VKRKRFIFIRGRGIVAKIVASAFGIIFALLTVGGFLLVKYETTLLEMFKNEFQNKINHSIEVRKLDEEKNLHENVKSNAELLSGICGAYLSADEPDRLKKSLHPYMERRLEILAISILNEKKKPFAAIWRSPDVTHGDAFPDTFTLNDNLSVTVDAVYEKAVAGSITVFYTDSVLANKLWLLKGRSLMESERFYNMLHSRLNNALINSGVGVFIILIIQIISLVVLLRILILRPVNMVSDVTRRLADFDLTVTVETTRKDEIGKLFSAINKMASEFRKMVSDVKSGGKRLASASDQMTGNISAIALTAEEISVNVRSVSDTTEQMSQNNNSIASAVEEMSASINEVGKNARDGSRIAEDAVVTAGKAGDATASLGEAASRIGEVTEIIKKIADKAGLLALNAHIEAASAGDAGKGFAVVANEIKAFANQITRAADDIAGRISFMQEHTEQAVTGINEVSDIIHKANMSSEMISYALEEQMKAAEEIASNAGQANTRAGDIAVSMEELANGAMEMSMNVGMAAKGKQDEEEGDDADVRHIDASASEVARLARELLELVEKFKV